MNNACKQEERGTALQVVWRNPTPPGNTASSLERLVLDEYGAVYAIHFSDSTKVFEILLGCAE